MNPKSILAKFASNFKSFPVSGEDTTLPTGFIVVCIMAFATSVMATIHFCRAMGGGMHMPGGWTMTMMWMRMSGQTWFTSAINFLLMWSAMMVAMMLPSVLPTFLKTRRATGALFIMAIGYFIVWSAAGAGIYMFGAAFATATIRWEDLSRTVPTLFGALLIAAGTLQFTRWKMAGLLRCRSPFGCAGICLEHENNFRLGCKQGMTCCLCCAAPMLMMLVLGMMNPVVITGVAIAIAGEKVLPRPEIVARFIGISAIIVGVVSLNLAYLRLG